MLFGKKKLGDNGLDNAIINFCFTLLRKKDLTTYKHTLHTLQIAEKIVDKLGVNGSFKKSVTLGAVLHDIGKIQIPSSILLKAEPLTKAQREEMDSHPSYGHNLIVNFCHFIDEKVLNIILSHHEKNGGLGYPNKIYKLDMETEIVAVSDMLAAIQEPRVYRVDKQGRLLDIAISEINKHRWSDEVMTIINNSSDVLKLNYNVDAL